jgi:hypothetical protein
MASLPECQGNSSSTSECDKILFDMEYLDIDKVTDDDGECTDVPVAYSFEPVIADLQLNSADSDGSSSSETEPDPDPDSENDRTTGHFWCTCGHCLVMSTRLECLCCREIRHIQYRIPPADGQGSPCIRDNADFAAVCLNRDVLDVSLLLMRDVMADSLTRPIDSR